MERNNEKSTIKQAERQNPPHLPNLSKDELEKLRQMSQMSMWLDSYQDIFSDFDPRPYSHRAISDDFLSEAKRASLDKKNGNVILKFLVPKDKRNLYHEIIIKKRIRDHFAKHAKQLKEKKIIVIKKGFTFVTVGIVLGFTATLLLFEHPQQTLLSSSLTVILQPASWFLLWEGLNQIVFHSKIKQEELDFYTKMASSEISFTSY